MSDRVPTPGLVRALGLLALWSLVGLAFASQFYLSSVMLGSPITWGEAIRACLGDWYAWALLSVPILWFVRRYPPEGGAPWSRAFLHLAAALAFSLAYVVLRALIGEANGRLIGESSSFWDVFRPLLLRTFPFNLLIYGVIVALSHALSYYRKYHQRTVQALELEKHLAEARLQALKRQLEPHFLFNTLNGIASLMYSDVAAADRMLVRLSELLRLAMNQSSAPEARLREELSFVGHYLEIEKIRFRGRLEVEVDVEPDTLEALVPSMVLQPLVENAIRHGIEPRRQPGRIEISARRQGDRLLVSVADDGAGLPTEPPQRVGIGIANTRARLQELYGKEHRFELRNRPEGGCIALLEIAAHV
ncbi:MAG TPA: sensor histidine kinase [Opitutaceae bacterium]|jgi:signal transduction histidine kinase